MTEIPSKYSPAEAEGKWYDYWMKNNYFHSEPDDREPFTIVIPPPNVTGVLHMGHMLNNTIQDVLVRRARMQGKNACWVPGTDHASIATEAKVVQKLKAEGVDKHDLTREEFMEHAWEWTDKHGGIILDQLKRLGASCDWDRTVFTMDDIRYESVIKSFVDLYNDGYIYRGYRMVNWDPEALTTVSDEEVIHKDIQSKLYHVRYQVEGEDEFVTIATTRPETILGDSAVCINPNDERYSHLKGKRVIVPIANRSVPIIEDDYVDMEFGTGCLKITPAHDINDKEIGERHKLDVIDILNDNGTLNKEGLHYEGIDRFEARKQIVIELDEKDYLVKSEDYQTSVGTSERTGAIIEPKVSLQWFVAMKKLAGPALKAVMDDEVKLIPSKFKNTYRHWMENVRDWCISRQLYWGHQIPAWYYGSDHDDFVVAMTEDEALEKAKEKSGNQNLTAKDLRQDNDVLDTWFSSWLWPMSVFDGIRNPDNEEVNYYYKTNDLVTAPEILFFWVARMIMAGYYYRDQKPFDNVYLTGIVRDKEGRKMSKSLGNSPDPIGLMERYGADGVRVGMLFTSPAGNDLPFDEQLCEQGRNFANKIWNALRLLKSWKVDEKIDQPETAALANEWFTNRFTSVFAQIERDFSNYRISDALMGIYKLIWDDYCSWFLEMIKPGYGDPVDEKTIAQAIEHFENLIKVLHPFMPFLTEELWHRIEERDADSALIVSQWPNIEYKANEEILTDFKRVEKVIAGIRTFRKQNNIPQKESLKLFVKTHEESSSHFDPIVAKLNNLESIEKTDDKIEGAYSFVEGSNEYFIPLEGAVDVEEQKEKIKEEIDYMKGFLKKVEKKLSNERFVQNAPEKVVEMERQKQHDAESKIKVLEEQLAGL
ncbi:valine--tRNA ligase [Salibacter sp.]|uniref:valine--tRNA ligase n=1 Tax=Salibacter sp. TaxID=2010995 RepID=UPI0028700D82|nr:valine--tRNA ligase [Salibacter sp.]MDR9398507.1 valine--tRNA ligase [Salibacter sp.]MDR9486441.1 valine--tRNA ligase [Salibacter sp.]